MLAVYLVELLLALAFTIEELQHDNADDVLLQVRVNARNGNADAPVAERHRTPEQYRHEHHERHHRQHERRQSGAQTEHNEHDEAESECVAQNRDQAGSK